MSSARASVSQLDAMMAGIVSSSDLLTSAAASVTEHLKLQRENAQMRATLAEQSSGSHRGGSVKGSIPDMLGDGY